MPHFPRFAVRPFGKTFSAIIICGKPDKYKALLVICFARADWRIVFGRKMCYTWIHELTDGSEAGGDKLG